MDAIESRSTDQLALWRSDFGAAYTDRNDREMPERVEAWGRIIGAITSVSGAPKNVLEVGCNVGWNLRYLNRLGVTGLHGVEPQQGAVERARSRMPFAAVLHGDAFALPFRDSWFDLVFTSGVLIHIAPADLGRAMDEMYRVSRRWIVAIEYDDSVETEVPYRGKDGALWRRDHRAAWMSRHPDLALVYSEKLDASQGYDDCTAHVLERSAPEHVSSSGGSGFAVAGEKRP
jgi:pseudaminic acid biosynthesis-associated methylase